MVEYVDRFALRDALYDADAITMLGIKIINQFPTAVDTATVRWIPVTERLPESDGFYIVVMNGDIWGEPDVWSSTACGFYNGKWDEDWATISHWMPMPEPPKGE